MPCKLAPSLLAENSQRHLAVLKKPPKKRKPRLNTSSDRLTLQTQNPSQGESVASPEDIEEEQCEFRTVDVLMELALLERKRGLQVF
jgi:hypothetical protein